MDLHTVLLFLAGLALLIGGADLLVRGAVHISAALGVPPLVIGLTVVALGTASPELAVSINAARAGHADVSIGNIVGSNILNVLLILGLSALVRPLVVAQQLIRHEVPIMIGASVLLFLAALDGRIGMADGILMVGALAFYLVVVGRGAGKESRTVKDEYAREYAHPPPRSPLRIILPFLMVGAGLGALFVGTPWFTGGAVAFARALGVSELVISLTIVSLGTSLPEAATSVIASARGERDIAVGNVVGSNIFNILAVLGIASLAAGGIGVNRAAIRFDMPVMIAVAFLCLPVFFTNHTISRKEGALFLAYYGAYTTYLVLHAGADRSADLFGRIAFALVVLTVIPVLIGVWRALRAKGTPAATR